MQWSYSSHATKVKKYQDFIEYTENNSDLNFKTWTGNEYFFSITPKENDDTKYKIKIKYDAINNFLNTHLQDLEIDPPHLNSINTHPAVIF